jgi:aminopeptidase-like protein
VSDTLFPAIETTEDCAPLAERAMQLIREIYPICRSITGPGVRETLAHVARHVPLECFEVPSGTPVFDWEVPREWVIRDAFIADSQGRRVVDFRRHNLHVVGYSTPVRARMSLAELRPHLHSLPERPDWIPYRTSYYSESWGFCLAHRELQALPEGEYEVVIDSELRAGSLTYAEAYVAGANDEEFLIHTHVCHPSLGNDNTTGIAVVAMLAAELARQRPRLSYRFVFAPGTIGSIAWLARNVHRLPRIRAGLVVGLVGDPAPLTYKRSRRGNTEIDHITAGVVHEIDRNAKVVDFSPYGYDERQFCSPGINLPIGRLTRSPNDAYPEYHTSADNLELIRPDALAESFLALMRVIRRVDSNRLFRSLNPNGEPRLGKHGLFHSVGGVSPAQNEEAMLWLLNQADGSHGLNDVSAASGIPISTLTEAAAALVAAGLLEETSRGSHQSAHATSEAEVKT